MIQHSFKIMWNQKRKYGFILFELSAIFLVIFLTMMYMIDQFTKYFEGTGCEISNVYYLGVATLPESDNPPPDYFQRIRKRLVGMESVELVSFSRHAAPYGGMGSASGTYQYGEKSCYAGIHYADRHFPSVLKMELSSGKWFDSRKQQSSTIEIPVVINQTMAKKLFGNKDPLGKIIRTNSSKYKVTGVLRQFKNSDFEASRPDIFISLHHPKTPSLAGEMLIRYKQGAHPEPGHYVEEIFTVLPKDDYRVMRSSRMEIMKKMANSNISGDILFVSLVVGFLLFNLILGLIGILGYNVNRRWSEMGIRRAVGSTRRSVRRLIFFEMLALTLMALLPVFIVIVQIPAFEWMPLTWPLFTKATIASLVLIFVLVFTSVLYPGIMASKIQPAVALKEE